MNASSALRRSVFAVATLLVAGAHVGCSSSDGADAQGLTAPNGQGARATPSRPRTRYVHHAAIRGCTSRPSARAAARAPRSRAKNGQWVPEPLFADAPEDVQVTTCAYRWSGAKYSRPDRDAIAAKVGYTNGLASACGTSSTPDVGLLHPIPDLDIFAQAGSVGCDVCGVLRHGKIWVILPPEKIAQKQFEVRLDNGQTRAFQIEPTAARALTITLPPPPPGTSYRSAACTSLIAMVVGSPRPGG